MNEKEVKFITFEGSEGCGKSTQSKLLYEYLRNKGYNVVYLREPGGTEISEKIREILLDPKNHITPTCETLLYMASRAQVVDEIIKPALLQNKIVICDRFLDSTVVYQGFGLGVDIRAIKFIGNFSTFGIKPDLTIFLDLPVKKGLKHREFKKDRIERRPYSYHIRVRKGYFTLARQESKRIRVIKVNKDKDVTGAKIRALVMGLIED
jgi:dTMP kinase